MSQACGKIPTDEEVGWLVQTIANTVSRYGRIWQGDIGEEIAAKYAVEKLGMTLEKFDKQLHGFDNVLRNQSGKLVILESKATKVSGVNALGQTKHGREGSVEWVDYKARLMCDPTSSFYTEANAKIGQEILAVGAENVQFLIVHTDIEAEQIDETWLR